MFKVNNKDTRATSVAGLNVGWHCVKSVQIQSYFLSVFSCIRTEYRKIRTRNNSVFWHISHSVGYQYFIITFWCKRHWFNLNFMLSITFHVKHHVYYLFKTWLLCETSHLFTMFNIIFILPNILFTLTTCLFLLFLFSVVIFFIFQEFYWKHA